MMRRQCVLFLALGSALLFLGHEASGGASPEQKGAGPVISSGCEYDYPPYCIVKENGEADGFSVELLRAVLTVMNREVRFKGAPWPELKQDLAESRLQVLPLVGRTPEREALYGFTFPYLTMHGTIVVRDDETGIGGLADLKGRRVAVLKGDNAEEFLRREETGAVLVTRLSFLTALRELSSGDHDAVVIQRLLAHHLMQEAKLRNLKTVGPPLFKQSFCFAVRKGDHDLLALLNEGLAIVIADGTFRSLYTRWFGSLKGARGANLRVTVGGDRAYPPYEFLDPNGEPAGFNVDLTRAIAKQMGITVDIRLDTWNSVRKGLEDGEIDVVQGMFFSPERDKTFDFSPTHTVVQHVIAVREGSPEPQALQDLAGMSILVMAGDLMEDVATEHGLAEALVPVETQEDALRLLVSGKHDCALVARIPALYWIEKNGWRNLQVSDRPVVSAEYCYAVPHDKKDLLWAWSEGLAALKATGEYRKIQARWLSPYQKPELTLGVIARYAGLASLPFVVLLLVGFLWSRTLQHQVAARTQELTAEIAERKRVEKTVLELNKELERSNQELEQFAYVASHDLQEPLRMVASYTQLLQTHYRGKLDQDAQEYIAFATDGAERMKGLIRDLLEYSRITTHGKAPEAVDVNDVVEEALGHLALIVDECQAKVTVEELPRIKGDRTQLVQLFQNLIGNALKYRIQDPPQVCISARRDGAQVLFAVQDNGIGIPAEHRKRIFEIFQRLHTKEEYPGTGIGLAVCKRIVERHGGRIWVESEMGQGSTFFFTLESA